MDTPFTTVPLPAQLTVTTTTRDDVRVLTPVGDLDAATAPQFAAVLAEIDAPVVVDLSRVGFLGCAGIRALFAAPSAAVVCSGAARRVLEMTGADEELALHPSLTAALAAPTVR